MQACHKEAGYCITSRHLFAGQWGILSFTYAMARALPRGRRRNTHIEPHLTLSTEACSSRSITILPVMADSIWEQLLKESWGMRGFAYIPPTHPQISLGLIFYLLIVFSLNLQSPRICMYSSTRPRAPSFDLALCEPWLPTALPNVGHAPFSLFAATTPL